MALRTDTFELSGLHLSSGEGRRLELAVAIEPFELSGERYAVTPDQISARLDVSRMTGDGYALRLRFAAQLSGPCMRCLEPATPQLRGRCPRGLPARRRRGARVALRRPRPARPAGLGPRRPRAGAARRRSSAGPIAPACAPSAAIDLNLAGPGPRARSGARPPVVEVVRTALRLELAPVKAEYDLDDAPGREDERSGSRAPAPPSADGPALAVPALRGLLELARLSLRQPPLTEVLDAVARTVAEAVEFSTVVINVYRPAGRRLRGDQRPRRRARALPARQRHRWLDLGVAARSPLRAPRRVLHPRRGGVLRGARPGARVVHAGDAQARAGIPEGDWRPDDALFAPIEGPGGRRYGVISVDDPISGRVPTSVS